MEDHQSLSSPLLLSTTSRINSSFLSFSTIFLRLLMFFLIGIISLWANREASKGFQITILNDLKHSPAGQRFNLLYVSNDEATRILLNASNFVEALISPSDSFPKKEIKAVHLRLLNLSDSISVEKSESGSEFFINLSPSILGQRDAKSAMAAAILRGISTVWLFDGDSEAPATLLAGIVEYVSVLAGFERFSGEAPVTGFDLLWWKNTDPTVVAQFLDYYEGCYSGFIRRLNRGLKSRWHDRTVENALGSPAQRLCGFFNRSGSGVIV